jgi:hypothetical protein
MESEAFRTHMNYYHCSAGDLHREILRRGYDPLGTRDQLSEALLKDDRVRGTDATTVMTQNIGPYMPRELTTSRTAEFGLTAPAMLLVNESTQSRRSSMQLLTMFRNHLLDDEHILPNPAALLRIWTLLHDRWQSSPRCGRGSRSPPPLSPYGLHLRGRRTYNQDNATRQIRSTGTWDTDQGSRPRPAY